jgi:hypothetical protein
VNPIRRIEGDAADTVIGMNVITMERILKCRDKFNAGDMIALWMFYAKNARYQGTFRIWSTTGFTAKGLGWTEAKVRKAKLGLEFLGLIENFQAKDERGSVKRCYVRVFHLVSERKTHPDEIAEGGKPADKCLDTTATVNASENSLREKFLRKTKGTGKPAAVASKVKPPEKPKPSIKDSPSEKAKRHVVPPAIRYTRKQVNDAVESQGCVNIIEHKPQLYEELKAFGWRDKYGKPIRNIRDYVNGLEWKLDQAKRAKFRR